MDIRQFDILYVDFNKEERVGSEQSGYRPAVVIQNDVGNKFCPTVLVIPLTSIIKKICQPTHKLLTKDESNGLTKDSMLLGESLTSVSKERIVKKVGRLTKEEDRNKVIDVYMANLFGKNVRMFVSVNRNDNI